MKYNILKPMVTGRTWLEPAGGWVKVMPWAHQANGKADFWERNGRLRVLCLDGCVIRKTPFKTCGAPCAETGFGAGHCSCRGAPN